MTGMETERRRHRFQFTLKGLLILTLVVASFFGGRASMWSKVEDAKSRAKTDRDDRDFAIKNLRSLVDEVNDFKTRHGIPLRSKIGDVHLTKVTEGKRQLGVDEEP